MCSYNQHHYSSWACCCIIGSDYAFFTSAISRYLFLRIHIGLVTESWNTAQFHHHCVYISSWAYSHIIVLFGLLLCIIIVSIVCVYVCFNYYYFLCQRLSFFLTLWQNNGNSFPFFYMGPLFLAKKWLCHLVLRVTFFPICIYMHAYFF